MDKINKIMSDELLAAYIDGNTTTEENVIMQSYLNDDSEVNDIINFAQKSSSFVDDFDLIKGDYGYLELGLDPVFSIDELKLPDSIGNYNIEHVLPLFDDVDVIDKGDSIDITETINNDVRHEQNTVVGNINVTPQGEIDLNIFQGQDNSCALRCQEIIMRDYGIIFPKKEMIEFAEKNHWYNDGTLAKDVGNVLDAYGIETNRTENNTLNDILRELEQGHRVIVGVDSGELWADSIGKKAYETFEDILGHDSGADHALIVSSFNVNPDNPENISVVLTDSGSGVVKEYSLNQFQDAWKDAKCMMVSTKQPAPYQYNAETHMMEPSNFATDYVVNSFIQSNTFQLPADAIPEGYVPSYGADGIDLSLVNSDYLEYSSTHLFAGISYDSSRSEEVQDINRNETNTFIKQGNDVEYEAQHEDQENKECGNATDDENSSSHDDNENSENHNESTDSGDNYCTDEADLEC